MSLPAKISAACLNVGKNEVKIVQDPYQYEVHEVDIEAIFMYPGDYAPEINPYDSL